MSSLRNILSAEKPPEEDKKQLKADRRMRAYKRFITLSDKEREKLFDFIVERFRHFEMHMSSQKLSKKDFVYASLDFMGSYLFDLSMDIADSIEKDFAKKEQSESATLNKVIFEEKKVVNEAKFVERRYNDS